MEGNRNLQLMFAFCAGAMFTIGWGFLFFASYGEHGLRWYFWVPALFASIGTLLSLPFSLRPNSYDNSISDPNNVLTVFAESPKHAKIYGLVILGFTAFGFFLSIMPLFITEISLHPNAPWAVLSPVFIGVSSLLYLISTY